MQSTSTWENDKQWTSTNFSKCRDSQCRNKSGKTPAQSSMPQKFRQPVCSAPTPLISPELDLDIHAILVVQAVNSNQSKLNFTLVDHTMCYLLSLMLHIAYDQDNHRENTEPKLPLIPSKSVSSREVHALEKRQRILLPTIRESKVLLQQQYRDDIQSRGNESGHRNYLASEVLQKLQRTQRNDSGQQEQSFDYNFDFESQVNKGREMIKQHKIKRIADSKGVSTKVDSKAKKIQQYRNQSLHEKRDNDNRYQSIENKLRPNNKKFKREKSSSNGVRYSSKDLKPKPQKGNKATSAKKNSVYHLQSRKGQQIPMKVNKSANLFDSIQMFLENPNDLRKQSKRELVGLSLLKAKRDIEDKIKALNKEMGTVEENQSPSSVKWRVYGPESNAGDWRKLQFKQNQLHCHESNFEHQMDRVNVLQEKTSVSLDGYLEHQVILAELEEQRKQLFKRKQPIFQ